VAQIDYAVVLGISGNTVTLDRPLKYAHVDGAYEPTGDSNWGTARICLMDTGGSGIFNSDARMIQQIRWQGITFLINTNNTDNICYSEGCMNVRYENCTLLKWIPTMSGHATVSTGTQSAVAEIDKMIETVFYLTPTAGEIAEATGVQYLLIKGGTSSSIQVAPRQLRIDGTTITTTNPTFSYAISNAQWYGYAGHWIDTNTTYVKGSGSNSWTAHLSPTWSLTIGTDITWGGADGLQLTVPQSVANFMPVWCGMQFPGAIASVDGVIPFGSAAWGYVDSFTGDATNIYLHFVWVNGAKPTSGTLYPMGKARRWDMLSNTFGTGMSNPGANPGFARQQSDQAGAPTIAFPAGYPFT
jgi:hypothetical protein